MSDEKEALRRQEQLRYLPPTYDDAVASSSRSNAGGADGDRTRETSRLLSSTGGHDDDDDGGEEAGIDEQQQEQERQRRRPEGYRAPTVRSVRSSFDSDSSFLPSSGGSGRSSADSLRREILEMDIEEPQTQRPSRLRESLSKQLNILGGAISSFSSSVGSRFGWLTRRLPRLPSIPFMTETRLIAMQRMVIVMIVILVVYALFISDTFTFSNQMGSQLLDPNEAKVSFVQNIDGKRLRHSLKYLSSFDHVAGTEGDFMLAEYVAGKFKEAGLDNVRTERYEVYLNYAERNGRRVAIVEPSSMKWEAKLEEADLYKDKNRKGLQTPAFFGLSKSGSATGPLIYANSGAPEDFAYLAENKIDVKGAIVIIRSGGTQGQAGMQVKAAEDAGAAGVIIYNNPKDSGSSHGRVWPSGRWEPDDSVQRDSVALSNLVIGDVLTPGFASKPDAKRIKKEKALGLPKIPSIPISWRDAKHLLESLKDHGQKVPDYWQRGAVPDGEWWTGNKDGPKVNLKNEQKEQEKQPIWNVLGTIPGYDQGDKKIIIGNHRDAWCYGAADPMSGTAALLEIVRLFGEMRKFGWQPLRTIEIASWDAKEYNMIGSTEWVEDHIRDLWKNAIAYINVDAAVSGNNFEASGAPVLLHALERTLHKIEAPYSNRTLRDLWGNRKLNGIGSAGDYAAFSNFAGTPSIDLKFQGEGFPYHSCYDTFEWMEKYGDPKFEAHVAMVKVWGLLTMELSDSYILAFDFQGYAERLGWYADELEKYSAKKAGSKEEMAKNGLDFTPLHNTIKEFKHIAETFDHFKQEWESILLSSDGVETSIISIRRLEHNAKMSDFDTYFLDNSGLDGRPWCRNPVFAPSAKNSHEVIYYPSIREAVDKGDWKLAMTKLKRVSRLLIDAYKTTIGRY